MVQNNVRQRTLQTLASADRSVSDDDIPSIDLEQIEEDAVAEQRGTFKVPSTKIKPNSRQ